MFARLSQVKLPFGLEYKVYDKILPYLATLENPLDICAIVTAFFETLNSITTISSSRSLVVVVVTKCSSKLSTA